MLIMPMLYKNKIYNVIVKLKNVYEDPKTGFFEKHYESDIIVNGNSYNHSHYYVENAPLNNVIDFIRNKSLLTTAPFVLTSRRNGRGEMKTYRISQPPKKISDELDSFYSSMILNMKKEIPGQVTGRYISLKQLGFSTLIDPERISMIRRAKMNQEKLGIIPDENNPLTDFSYVIDFLNKFDCTVQEEATIDEKELQNIIQSFCCLGIKEMKKLQNYYTMAKDNAEIYANLNSLVKYVTGKPFGWLKRNPSMIKMKSHEEKYGN